MRTYFLRFLSSLYHCICLITILRAFIIILSLLFTFRVCTLYLTDWTINLLLNPRFSLERRDIKNFKISASPRSDSYRIFIFYRGDYNVNFYENYNDIAISRKRERKFYDFNIKYFLHLKMYHFYNIIFPYITEILIKYNFMLQNDMYIFIYTRFKKFDVYLRNAREMRTFGW